MDVGSFKDSEGALGRIPDLGLEKVLHWQVPH